MQISKLPALALIVACASSALVAPGAAAQFTGVVTPPPAKPRVDTVAKRDSVAEATKQLAARVTDMKRWVDSAALAIAANPPADTTSVTVTPSGTSATASTPPSAEPESATVVSSGEVTEPPAEPGAFRNGEPAPATASPLPLYGVLGAVTLILGLALRRR